MRDIREYDYFDRVDSYEDLPLEVSRVVTIIWCDMTAKREDCGRLITAIGELTDLIMEDGVTLTTNQRSRLYWAASGHREWGRKVALLVLLSRMAPDLRAEVKTEYECGFALLADDLDD